MNYGTDWREDIPADEAARFEDLANRMAAIQAAHSAKHGDGRTLHRPAVGGVQAVFTVREDLASVLPAPLHVGPFVAGARYDAFVRFSHGSWERPKKDKPDVRGMAIKLLGVGGAKVLSGTEDPRTQDFLLIQTPTAPSASPEEFVGFLEVASSGSELTLLPRLAWRFGLGTALAMLKRMFGALLRPFPGYASGTFFGVTAYRLGPTAAHWGVVPVTIGDAPAASGSLAANLAARLKDGLAWDFRVQLFQDAARTPIEDATIEWAEDAAPWITVGRLEIPPQDLASAHGQRVAAYIEGLSFDPWHAVTELQPLGCANRARKAAYFVSTKNRKTTPEPQGPVSFE